MEKALDVYKIEEGVEQIKSHELSQGIDILQNIWSEYENIEDRVNIIFFLPLNFGTGLTVTLDCLIVKDNTLIILEMKNWGGKIKVHTDGENTWSRINEGSDDEEEIVYYKNGKISEKNPFSQIHNERVTLGKFVRIELMNKKQEDIQMHSKIMSQVKSFVVTGNNSEIIFTEKSPKIRSWFDAFPVNQVSEKIRDLRGERKIDISKYIMEYVETLKYTKIRCPKGLSFEDQNICNKQSYNSPVLNQFLQEGTDDEILKAIDIINTLKLENYCDKLKLHLRSRNSEIKGGVYRYFFSLVPNSVNNIDYIVSEAMKEGDITIVKSAIDYVFRYHNFSSIFKESLKRLQEIASYQNHHLQIDAIDAIGMIEGKDSREFLDRLLVQTFDFNKYKKLTLEHREAFGSLYKKPQNETYNFKAEMSIIHETEKELINILKVFSHILKIGGRCRYKEFVAMCERILYDPGVIGYDWTDSLFSKGESRGKNIFLPFEHDSARNIAMHISSYFSEIKGKSRAKILIRFLDKSEDWGKELIIKVLGEIGNSSACKAIEPYLAIEDFNFEAIASSGKLKCKNHFYSILTTFNSMLDDKTIGELRIIWNSLSDISEKDLINYLEKKLGEQGEGNESKEKILMLMITDENRISISSQMILNLCSLLGIDFLSNYAVDLLKDAYQKSSLKEFIRNQLFQLAKKGNSKERIATIIIMGTEIFDFPDILSALEGDMTLDVNKALEEARSMLQD